ncbi:TonB-dependent receptor, partial [Aliarcobacter butzleri]
MEREQYSLNWEGNWDLGKSIIGIHQIESANFGRSLPLNAEQRKLILDNKRTSSNPTGIWTDLNTAMADPRFTALLPRPVRTLESTNTTYSAKYELPFEEHFLVIGTEYLQAQLKDDAFTLT